MVSSTVLYLVREKNIKVRDTFLQGFKKKKRTDQHVHSKQHGLAPAEGVLSLKEYQHWRPRKRGI